MKVEQLSPQASELTDRRAATAPTGDELQRSIEGLVDWMMRECELQGLQYQQFERASGLAKGSLSNIKGRRSCRFDAFIALCHGLGRKPSEVAALFLDRPQRETPLAVGREVPLFVAPAEFRANGVKHATPKVDAVSAKAGVPVAKGGRSDTKVSASKKTRNR